MANTTAVANINTFKSVLNDKSIRNRVKTSLGENAGSFIASMLDLYEGEPYLQMCDPAKVAMECLKAASLNLPIVKSLGYAYVVPYKNKRGQFIPTFIIGYKGLIQLAQRSGQYQFINADAIYEGEDLGFNRLSGQISISGTKTSDKATGYFAYFKLVNGFEKSFYMSVEDIRKYAERYSKSYNASSSPWRDNFDAMAKKTVLRQILKYGPMSAEMQEAERNEYKAAQAEAQAEADENANRVVIDVNPETGEIKSIEEPQTEQAEQFIPETAETIEAETAEQFAPEPSF